MILRTSFYTALPLPIFRNRLFDFKLKKTNKAGSWLGYLEEPVTLDLRIMYSSPMLVTKNK